MSTFTFDTSGVVTFFDPVTHYTLSSQWTDLTPFAQGYVEALFADAARTRWPEICDIYGVERALECWKPTFSDLSPEALGMILADCRVADHIASSTLLGFQHWAFRQAGRDPDQPPLTVSLNDDGKIVLAVKS